jgi:hypothetical protein
MRTCAAGTVSGQQRDRVRAGLIAAAEVIRTLWLGCGDVKSLCCDQVIVVSVVAESGEA